MRTAWGRVGFAVVVVVGLFWPVVLSGGDDSADTGPDPARISTYAAGFTVAGDGGMDVVEQVSTEMPPGRHGIFRFWDVVDASDKHARLEPEDISITQDGQPATVEMSWEHNRRYRVAKVGDPGRFLDPGIHVYRITYHVDGALSSGPGGRARFYWNLVPGGWGMAIGRARLHVHLPHPTVGAVHCAVGAGSTSGCDVKGAGGSDLDVTAGPLPPRTPVTVSAVVDQSPPGRASLPWSQKFDEVFSRSVPVLVVVLLISLIGLVVGWLFGRLSREDDPGFPLLYVPPEGVGPAQAAYVADETIPSGAMAATLLHQAERGLTRLVHPDGSRWVVEGLATPEQWASADPATYALGTSLGVTSPGYQFHADGTVPSGKMLATATGSFDSAVKGWALSEGLLRRQAAETVGRLLVYAAILLAGVLIVFRLTGFTMVGLPFAAFAIGGLVLLKPGAMTRRTASGRDLWSRAGGFKRILATESAETRFDFSARRDLYTAYIPWAVAFGCADAWQRKYEAEMHEPAPTPVWLGGYYGAYPGLATATSFVDSFQSTLDSSISAYQATQGSSSSGGGGFSGGGGGGGGGGGSW